MEPEKPSELVPPPSAQPSPVRFSWARVLFTLSITCPVMVALLAGYDHRVRMVPLSHVVVLMAPFVGVPAYLVMPRSTESHESRTTSDAVMGVILLLVFYLVFVTSYVGLAAIRR